MSLTDKRVTSAIIDHYNTRTGQCDPSLDTLAVLLGVHRRTVIRSTNQAVRFRYLDRVRHGSHFHRNLYIPNWTRFREIEAAWKRRRREHSQRFDKPKLSPSSSQVGHDTGGGPVTQTCPRNISNETFLACSDSDDLNRDNSSRDDQRTIAKEKPTKPYRSGQTFLVKQTSSREAADNAAERRWSDDLHRAFADKPDACGMIIERFDLTLISGATEAELKSRGGGLAYILDQLRVPPSLEASG